VDGQGNVNSVAGAYQFGGGSVLSIGNPADALKGLCRNSCRRYAARIGFPLYPGLTPRAHCAAAAARLV
jgi:hypothetical protein